MGGTREPGGCAAAGTPDRMGGTLYIVTSGVGTTTQVLKSVGTFNGPSSGAWSYNNLVPLYAPDGSQAAFKITTATTTLRFWLREGDFDWFALYPVTGIRPKITTASPLANTATPAFSAVPRDAKVRLTVEDFSTAVTLSRRSHWPRGLRRTPDFRRIMVAFTRAYRTRNAPVVSSARPRRG